MQEVRDQHAVPLSVSRLCVQVGQPEVRVAEDDCLVRLAKLGGGMPSRLTRRSKSIYGLVKKLRKGASQ